jgi:negative regulator of flagellin synthesis FlgM
MAIQSLTGKINNSALASNIKQAKKSEELGTKMSKEPVTDSVAITATAKKMTEAIGSSGAAAPINEEKIEGIKKALENGTYSISAERIAKKMIEIER